MPSFGQGADQVQNLHPVVQVEVARRLVEQQHAWLLRERLRERESLQVTAGELVGGLVGKAQRVGELHRALDHLAVVLARRRESREMRVAPHLHEAARRHREGRAHLLRHDADEPRALQRAHRRSINARQLQPSAKQLSVTGDRPQQRRLARAIRPDQPHNLARVHLADQPRRQQRAPP